MTQARSTDVRQRARVVLSIHSLSPTSPPSAAQAYNSPEGGWPAAIEAASREVFGLMLGTELTRSPEASPAKGEMTAMVGLVGGLSGVLNVRCSFTTAALLASRMLGIDVNQDEAATRDALGEICNVVAGSLKTKVSGLEDTCFLSTPTIVTGHDFKVFSPGDSETIEVPLAFEEAMIWVTLIVQAGGR